jgi:hypothetical protein
MHKRDTFVFTERIPFYVFFYVYFYLLFMAEFDLCRDKECKYACTAYDISKSCRNEEAEEVV